MTVLSAIIVSPISTQLGEVAKRSQSRCSGKACKDGQRGDGDKVTARDHCDLRTVSSCRLPCRVSLVVFMRLNLHYTPTYGVTSLIDFRSASLKKLCLRVTPKIMISDVTATQIMILCSSYLTGRPLLSSALRIGFTGTICRTNILQ